ncbi:cell division protein FtsZ [Rhodobacteraceae bacterium XHP0102]|nr:cell division protein FtsZ [Rhodobacteraceae bacterium XHP0102]
MTLNLSMPDTGAELKPRITVFGVGGAGGNAVNNMIEQALDGCEFVVANTDAQALQQSKAPQRIQIGARVTEGLGAGARPSVGASAAEESIEEIVDQLAGAHMCFITAGMGGGTGTGAAPIIAQAARELGVLTVGVVTKPFQFEGSKRMRQAEEGIEQLQKVVDTLIIIPNQNLFRLANEKTTFTEAFAMADDVLYQGVKGVTDLMVRPGLINLDFADVRAVMNEMGKAMMGTGEAEGETRAIQAAEKAIANPLLDEISLKGAKGVLINITGGYDLTLFELDEAANRIREEVDPDANIIVGSTLDTSMEGRMRVSVVATGIDVSEMQSHQPERVYTAARQPIEAPQDVEPVTAEPEVAEAADPAPEPFLFSELQEESPRADTARAMEREDDADVPAPVYDSAMGEAAPHPQETAAQDAPETTFVAPIRPAAGTPSPQALDRLKNAIATHNGTTARPAAPQRPVFADKPAQPRKSFGINSLLSRMTGQTEHEPPVTRSRPDLGTQHDPMMEDEAVDPEQERIEVPAFLRRQAN